MQIIDGVWSVDGLRISNVFLVRSSGGVAIVDTSGPGSATTILDGVRAAGFVPSDVEAIVITHAHFDHIGSLEALQRLTRAPVYAPAAEIPAIEGRMPLPCPPGWRGLLLRQWSRLVRPARVDFTLSGEAALPLPGWQAIATPGHTPGHHSLYDSARGALIAGDALFRIPRLAASPWFVSSDYRRALQSVALLAGLPLRTAMFGHGAPLRDEPDLPRQLAAIARQYRAL